MTDRFESEQIATRDEAATILREMADGVTGGSLRFGDDDAIVVDVPDSVAVETEFETEDGDVSVEVELEWQDSTTEDATAAAGEGADREAPAVESAEEGSAPAVESAEGSEAPGAETVEDDEVSAVERAGDDDASAVEDAVETSVDSVDSPVGPAAPLESLARFEVYLDRGDEWRWRLVHRNGNVIATSGEGYTRKHNALKGLRSVMRNSPDAEVGDDLEQ